jgi:hypothetical protein
MEDFKSSEGIIKGSYNLIVINGNGSTTTKNLQRAEPLKDSELQEIMISIIFFLQLSIYCSARV